jgi:hypothetical protein
MEHTIGQADFIDMLISPPAAAYITNVTNINVAPNMYAIETMKTGAYLYRDIEFRSRSP